MQIQPQKPCETFNSKIRTDITSLPNEILEKIFFNFKTPTALCKLGEICKSWYILSHAHPFWKMFVLQRWPHLVDAKDIFCDYRKLYIVQKKILNMCKTTRKFYRIKTAKISNCSFFKIFEKLIITATKSNNIVFIDLFTGKINKEIKLQPSINYKNYHVKKIEVFKENLILLIRREICGDLQNAIIAIDPKDEKVLTFCEYPTDAHSVTLCENFALFKKNAKIYRIDYFDSKQSVLPGIHSTGKMIVKNSMEVFQKLGERVEVRSCESGDLKRQFQIKGNLLAVIDGIIYINQFNLGIGCYDEKTGKLLRSLDLGVFHCRNMILNVNCLKVFGDIIFIKVSYKEHRKNLRKSRFYYINQTKNSLLLFHLHTLKFLRSIDFMVQISSDFQVRWGKLVVWEKWLFKKYLQILDLMRSVKDRNFCVMQ